ncbi:protein of unknown function [Robiginitalea myxolifaciens]|uniref:DUF4834 domain-containing protein n=1 Tax=Robiginitalea myxolifaciens TaxID=400055 RepID=A0A1I6GVA0_9FLAO|nr:DUF4834 family protein [Robiginitalea myxolifaciens]SFR45987.1 protein of unknown function [Robiginitalea myxolifaciens]
MGFLTTILIILLAYYGLVLLGRLLFPWIRAYAVRRTEKHFEEFFNRSGMRQEPRQPEGSVTVEKPNPDMASERNKTSKKRVGEYIEFEEIE